MSRPRCTSPRRSPLLARNWRGLLPVVVLLLLIKGLQATRDEELVELQVDVSGELAHSIDDQAHNPPAINSVNPDVLREGDFALDHLLIVPEYKLIFCFIAKVSSLSFNDLLRSLRAPFDPGMLEGEAYGRIIPFGRNSYRSHNWSLQDLTDALHDPAWLKAVFYREPLTRFVSAYRDKCGKRTHGARGLPPRNRRRRAWSPLHERKANHKHDKICLRSFGEDWPSFETVVDRLLREPRVTDPHWRRQHEFCGGLDRFIGEFQFVEVLERATSREKVGELLARAHVPNFNSDAAFNLRFPPTAPGDASRDPHATNADAAARSYYTPYLACVVFQYYYDDYALFGMQLPEWARAWG
ncbi:Sulfotransferase family-domain-containing protein, partial [Tribonema minus]